MLVEANGCNKKETPANQTSNAASQAPPTTYATPTPDQLYQLVAPIALFPDNLLAQVLAGSTFPDQVTAAYQWLQQNSSLTGQQLMEAVDQQPWDASVKGLTQFSDVLKQMATNLTWTSSSRRRLLQHSTKRHERGRGHASTRRAGRESEKHPAAERFRTESSSRIGGAGTGFFGAGADNDRATAGADNHHSAGTA